VCLCDLYGSEKKQRLFHYTAFTDGFLYAAWSMFTVRYVTNLYIAGTFVRSRAIVISSDNWNSYRTPKKETQ